MANMIQNDCDQSIECLLDGNLVVFYCELREGHQGKHEETWEQDNLQVKITWNVKL